MEDALVDTDGNWLKLMRCKTLLLLCPCIESLEQSATLYSRRQNCKRLQKLEKIRSKQMDFFMDN